MTDRGGDEADAGDGDPRATGRLDELADAELVELANRDPQRVLDAVPPERRTTAGRARAVAVALRVLGRLDEALTTAERGVELATDAREAARCRLTAAPALAQLGRVDDALAALDAAEPALSGVERAEVRFQRGGVLGLVAEHRRARREFSAALGAFRRAGLAAWEADALMNRGLVAGYLGATSAARADLTAAADAFDRLGDEIGAGAALHNLALASLIAGEPVRSLGEFDEAHRRLADAGFPIELHAADHCEALLAVGLRHEAVELATAGVEALEAAGGSLEAATQRLVLAGALAHVGELDGARRHADEARAAFLAQGQEHRSLRAEVVRGGFDLGAGVAPRDVADRAEAAAERFGAAGLGEWRGEALLALARAALADGDAERGAAALSAHRRLAPPFPQLVERSRLDAELAVRRGDLGRSLRSARAGVRLVERERGLAASVELDDSLSDHVVALGCLGVGGLLATGRAREALRFAERASWLREEAPTGAVAVPASLVEHRAVRRAIEEAENERRDAAPLRRRERALRRAIRAERSRRRAADGGRRVGDVELPAGATGRRYVVDGTGLRALDLVDGRVRATATCSLDELEACCRELTFRARRALAGRGGGRGALDAVADDVDRALGRPGDVGDRSTLLHLALDASVPTVPLGLLPSLRDRAWVHVARLAASDAGPAHGARPASPGPVVLVAGPDLDTAEAEVDLLARRHPGARALVGAAATCSAVVEAIDGASLVHVAAHSALNTQNPMFSSITLADGDLTVHQLAHVRRAPSTVVLASCESATAVAVGATSIGLSSSLLRLGIARVVGTACEIPDLDVTSRVQRRLHDHDLAEHADALRAVRADPELDDDERLVAACLVPAALAPVVR